MSKKPLTAGQFRRRLAEMLNTVDRVENNPEADVKHFDYVLDLIDEAGRHASALWNDLFLDSRSMTFTDAPSVLTNARGFFGRCIARCRAEKQRQPCAEVASIRKCGLSPGVVAKAKGVGRRRIMELIRAGKLKADKLQSGKYTYYLIDPADLEDCWKRITTPVVVAEKVRPVVPKRVEPKEDCDELIRRLGQRSRKATPAPAS